MKENNNIENIISDIIERIKNEYQPEKIILFGSYGYGDPAPESDIGLLIIKDTDSDSMERWITVKKIVRDPKRGITVSPLVYTKKEIEECLKIGDFFIREILNKGKVLYG